MRKTSIRIGTVALYANLATKNVKVGSKGKAVPVGQHYATLSKGEARKVRKGLRAQGFAALAAEPRS